VAASQDILRKREDAQLMRALVGFFLLMLGAAAVASIFEDDEE